MSATSPFFSVVTPSWNQGRYLAACLDSVLAQGCPDLEHLLYDNCSTDETQDVLRRYPHVQWVQEPDRGQSHALNKAFARIRGEIVCWLNADDSYLPGTLAAVREAFADPAVTVLYGHVLVRDEGTGRERVSRGVFANRLDYLTWQRNKLHQPAVFFRRSVLEEVGPLREDLHYVMDMEFWWRLTAHHQPKLLDRPLAMQLYHPAAKTVARFEQVILERKRVFDPLLKEYAGRRRLLWTMVRQRNVARRYLALAEQGGARARGHVWSAFIAYPPVLFQARCLRAALGVAPNAGSEVSP